MERKFSRGGGRDFGGPREMHKATCADCKQECEVPFKPSGDRPVYCKDCYAKRRPPRRF
jgi:CxxC-x17-CxxC domain-containing protein